MTAAAASPPSAPLLKGLARLQLQQLALTLGPWSIDVAQVELLQVRSGPQGSGQVVLEAAQARLQGVRLQGPLAGLTGAAAQGASNLQPLQALEGTLRVFVPDAAWRLDADITLPVRQGHIDFDEVTVSHVGPDSTMGISPQGLHVDTPAGRQVLLRFGPVPPAGLQMEQRGGGLRGQHLVRRGALAVPAFLQSVLESAAGVELDAASAPALMRARLDAELQPGEGLLRAGGLQAVLQGRQHGHNRLRLQADAVGMSVTAALPSLLLADLLLGLGGLGAQAGRLEGGIELQVEGLDSDHPQLRLQASALVLQQLRLQGLPSVA